MAPKWHTQRVDWCKRVTHSIATTHSLNGHKNGEDEEDDIEKNEGQLWKKHDGLVCVACRKGMVSLVIGKMQSGWMVDQLHS